MKQRTFFRMFLYNRIRFDWEFDARKQTCSYGKTWVQTQRWLKVISYLDFVGPSEHQTADTMNKLIHFSIGPLFYNQKEFAWEPNGRNSTDNYGEKTV